METKVGSTLRTFLAAAFVAAASTGGADTVLDAAGGSVFLSTPSGGEVISDFVRVPGGPLVGFELGGKAPAPPALVAVSHSETGLAVHSGAGGSAPLTTSLFRSGPGSAPNPPFVLRDPRTGLATGPASVRTVALDPSEPAGATVLLDAGHVLVPRSGQHRGLALVRRASGEAVLVDFDFAGGPVRRTPLGFTPPIGSNKGSFAASPDGHVWAALASPGGIRLFDLGDLSATGPLQPVQAAALAVGPGFDPRSTHLGIIAILIGVVAQPSPAVSYQVGASLFHSAFDVRAVDGFRLLARQEIPPGASGLIEEDGIYFYILPYLEQDNLYRGTVGQAAELVPTAGR
jgi:hypothetical protein